MGVVASGVRRPKRAQARLLPPPRHFVTPLLGQEGSTPAHPRTEGASNHGSPLYNFHYSGRAAPESLRRFEQAARLMFNRRFTRNVMEAEQINAIARRLSDVESRAAELRRYL